MTFDHQRYQMDLKIDPVSYNSAFFGQVSVNCGNYRNRSEGTIFLPSALLAKMIKTIKMIEIVKTVKIISK